MLTPFNTKTMTLFLVCVSSIVLSIVIAETQKKLKIHEAPRIAPFLTLSSLLWYPCKRYPCWSLGELQFKPSFSTFHVKLTTHIPKYCSNSLDFLVLIILWSCCSTVTSLLTVWYILLMFVMLQVIRTSNAHLADLVPCLLSMPWNFALKVTLVTCSSPNVSTYSKILKLF